MTTEIIITGMALLFFATGTAFILVGCRRLNEAKQLKQHLDSLTDGLHKRQRELDLLQKQINTTAQDQARSERIEVSVKFDKPVSAKSARGTLALKLGHKILNTFPDSISRDGQEYHFNAYISPEKKK